MRCYEVRVVHSDWSVHVSRPLFLCSESRTAFSHTCTARQASVALYILRSRGGVGCVVLGPLARPVGAMSVTDAASGYY
jgi:hypothetical protein